MNLATNQNLLFGGGLYDFNEKCMVNLPNRIKDSAIAINRIDSVGPFLSYYLNPKEDYSVILDFWDKQSFKEAYRHSRLKCG